MNIFYLFKHFQFFIISAILDHSLVSVWWYQRLYSTVLTSWRWAHGARNMWRHEINLLLNKHIYIYYCFSTYIHKLFKDVSLTKTKTLGIRQTLRQLRGLSRGSRTIKIRPDALWIRSLALGASPHQGRGSEGRTDFLVISCRVAPWYSTYQIEFYIPIWW